jgi:NAD(P)-dependent dehydrogenase (short-subunit alcohol dehydrogenase family)
MSKRFEARTALVAGASRNIGLAIAQRLVADGARVVITARPSPNSVAPIRRSASRVGPTTWTIGPR